MRARIALIAALAVAAAVLLLSASAYIAVRQELLSRVDRTLTSQATRLDHQRVERGLASALEELFRPASALSKTSVTQVVETNGQVVAPRETSFELPVSSEVQRVAAGKHRPYFTNTTIGTTPVRMLVTTFGAGLALQEIQPVAGMELELHRLALVLGAAAAAGIVLALLLGSGVAGVALRPLRRLTTAAEHLAATRDLAQRIPVEGRDELSRLASSLNTLFAALQDSQLAQRQLVADASHELRTPLTSLRTNVEILAVAPKLDPETRKQLVEDLVSQLDGVSRLVGDLIELARQEGPVGTDRATELVSLDELVADVLAHAARSHPDVRFEHQLSPALVRGVAADLRRLAANLLDNAAKWSPGGGLVEVSLQGDRGVTQGATRDADPRFVVLSVLDHGRGIEPDDLAHVFDRFYRGSGGRQVPGSGLGLAIVERIVEAHGGSVKVESTPGEGTCFVVRLPSAEM